MVVDIVALVFARLHQHLHACFSPKKMFGSHDNVDLWRDTKVRYLGYANEVGEAFRPIAPRLVRPSYAVAFAYVFGDTYDKSTKAHSAAKVGTSAAAPTSVGSPSSDTKSEITDLKSLSTTATLASTSSSVNPGCDQDSSRGTPRVLAAEAAIDTLVWQTCASVAIPGFVINRAVAMTKFILTQTAAPKAMRAYAPTALGLAIIPLIIHPIDELVHRGMDETIRPFMRRKVAQHSL